MRHPDELHGIIDHHQRQYYPGIRHQEFLTDGFSADQPDRSERNQNQNGQKRWIKRETGSEVAPEGSQQRTLYTAHGAVHAKQLLVHAGQHMVFQPGEHLKKEG